MVHAFLILYSIKGYIIWYTTNFRPMTFILFLGKYYITFFIAIYHIFMIYNM